jgi:oxygen-dependent protoporphyrinogen oxidase
MTNQDQHNQLPVAIVGGGIAGLSAAWALQHGRHRPYVLLEAGRTAGAASCRTDAGRTLPGDANPLSWRAGRTPLSRRSRPARPWRAQLGLGETAGRHQRAAASKTYVLQQGPPATPLPDGVLMIVPTKFKPFVFSPLISPWGKLRMGMDLFIPPRK